MSKINLHKTTKTNYTPVDLNQFARKVVGAIFFTYFTYSMIAFIGWFFDLWWKTEHPLVTLIIGGILSTVVIFVTTTVVGLTAVILGVDLFRWVVFDKKFEYTREFFRGEYD